MITAFDKKSSKIFKSRLIEALDSLSNEFEVDFSLGNMQTSRDECKIKLTCRTRPSGRHIETLNVKKWKKELNSAFAKAHGLDESMAFMPFTLNNKELILLGLCDCRVPGVGLVPYAVAEYENTGSIELFDIEAVSAAIKAKNT